jgi:adenosylhomocysteine nucleosidase
LSNTNKPVAIIAAMPVELAPLIGKIEPQTVEGVDLFELAQAVVAVGGIGEKFARRAAEVAIEYAQPKLLLSAGIVGAISPQLKVGDVGRIREVVDVATGARYPTTGGEWVLATSQDVSDATDKHDLLTKFGADVVDMEAAAVAEVARQRGVEFASVKAISDDAEFAMPPLNRFIGEDGKFATCKFLMYVALHPRWWTTLGRIKANSELASRNLCEAVEHLLEARGQGLGARG